MPSSLTPASSRIPLTQVFADVPDPRDPRGVRHALPVILTCATAAVLSGAKTWVAVAEWVADADRESLRTWGIGAADVLPSESTIRRTMAVLDADDVDARIGAWMLTQIREVDGQRVISIDGKSLRGAGGAGAMPHLLAALEHQHGVVVAQQAVPDKGSEIPALRELLAAIDLTDVVVTADALHCQRATAQWITGQGGHYVLTVKANQPGLLADLKALPWAQVPAHTYVQTGRGRRIRRTVKTLEVPAWVDWPGAAQVVQVRRTRTINGRRHIEVVYAITSVPMTRAQPRIVASWIQGHWGIENSLHWVRDVTFDDYAALGVMPTDERDRFEVRVGRLRWSA